MPRSTRRIDIEDKGCSGEKFLAATEILFKPAMNIFENMQCAPLERCERVLCAAASHAACIRRAEKSLSVNLLLYVLYPIADLHCYLVTLIALYAALLSRVIC
jgi:hypothetical protein